MNQEIILSLLVGVRAFGLATIVTLYSLAGRGVKLPVLGKIRRRVWLPIIAALTMTIVIGLKCWLTSTMVWSWPLLGAIWASVGLQYGVYSLFSYGDTSWLRPLGKWLQRAIVHGVHAAGWVLIPIFTGAWIIYGLGIVIASLVGMVLGAMNPQTAAEEEGAIGLAEYAYVPFLV